MRKLLAVALRRGWVVVAAAAAVTALAVAVGSARPGSTLAQAVAVVPAGATDESPGNATQATQLAQTYVQAIPLDGAVLGAIAHAVDRTSSDVAGRVTVVGDPKTSVLLLRYEDTDRARALAGTSTLLTAVTGDAPNARSVAPDSLTLVRGPRVLRETTAARDTTTIPLGVILGLALGLVLLVAWERSDPRIDGAGELANAAGTPATALGDVAPGNIDALLERWRRLAGDGSGPHVVALLAGTRRAERLVSSAAYELATISASNGQLLRLGTAPPGPGGPSGERGLVVVTGGTPGGPAAGEAVAADAAVVVVTVPRGARATELRDSLDVLGQFGARPTWALLVRRSIGKSAGAKRSD
ncbi:MAG TPA: hypothetical protein VF250_03690 [Conexibacter sp.]